MNSDNATKKSVRASFTVEAALVLPIFIYAIVAIAYFLQIFLLQEYLQNAITETGYFSAKYAYIYEYLLNYDDTKEKDSNKDKSAIESGMDAIIAKAIDSSYYKIKLQEYLDLNIINESCIKEGFSGIHTYLSSYMAEEDAIDIVITYDIKLPLLFIPLDTVSMVQRVRMRGWSGHRVEAKNGPPDTSEDEEDGKQQEEIVYITETGTVYHLTKECSHLKLSIQKSTFGQLEVLRNESGGKYKKCSLCGNKGLSGGDCVYITDDGDRYHCNLSCSGLKRTIIEIYLSEVGSKRPCQRCGSR